MAVSHGAVPWQPSKLEASLHRLTEKRELSHESRLHSLASGVSKYTVPSRAPTVEQGFASGLLGLGVRPAAEDWNRQETSTAKRNDDSEKFRIQLQFV